MSIEEKRRAAFEAFCLSDAGGYTERHLEKDSQGNYLVVWEYWAIWNAALDSVVIELPYLSRGEYANQHSFNCAAESMGYARHAIESAGLKVK